MDYRKAYSLLFNAITDALGSIEEQNFGTAREMLMTAQQQAEELYMEDETNPV